MLTERWKSLRVQQPSHLQRLKGEGFLYGRPSGLKSCWEVPGQALNLDFSVPTLHYCFRTVVLIKSFTVIHS